jgi:hypothetical protein
LYADEIHRASFIGAAESGSLTAIKVAAAILLEHFVLLIECRPAGDLLSRRAAMSQRRSRHVRNEWPFAGCVIAPALR